jgi:chromatin assembly factor 1 subunit B
MWTLIENSSKMVEYAGSLNSGHNKPVNCLKFSHDGKYFASGSDDYTIIIWSQ